ncbi:hypothetical protein FoTM2_004694 [Fusarium oxysporum f. sp. vasinfectum]|nr:hypothetical protein FoTM2_004694 [Fusarium oxysporum f. sp. vasinfectum]
MSKDKYSAEVEKIWKEHLTDQPPQTPQQIKAGKALIELFLATTIPRLELEWIQSSSSPRETRDPNRPFQFNWKRIFVDGNYVIAHNHVENGDGTDGVRVVEILRYENGLFTEHWDTVTPVPPKSEWKNQNGVF